MRKLNVLSGPAAGRSLEIESELVIGREGADLTIGDQEVSRRHAIVRPVEGGVEVEDAGSRNGTSVNGELITEPVTLTSSGKIQIGDSEIELVVEEPAAEEREAPVAAPAVTRQQSTVPEPTKPAPGPPPERAPGPPSEPAKGPPGPPPGPRKAGKPGRRRSLVPIVVAVVVLAVAGVLAAVALSGGEDEAEAHQLRAVATTNILSAPAQTMTVVGVMQGQPIGRMSADIVRRVSAQPTPGGPVVPLRLTFLFTKPGGSFRADMRGRTWHTKADREEVRGKAAVTDGTGEFDGVKGSFNVFGDNPPGSALSKFTVRGTIEY